MPDNVRSMALFAVAAVLEIGGAWLVWQGVRQERGLAWVGAGIEALAGHGFVATFQSDPFDVAAALICLGGWASSCAPHAEERHPLTFKST